MLKPEQFLTEDEQRTTTQYTEHNLRDARLWSKLIFGTYDRETVLTHVQDEEWQHVRVSLLHTSLRVKYYTLLGYVTANNNWHARVCVTNYVNALKRGGLIK